MFRLFLGALVAAFAVAVSAVGARADSSELDRIPTPAPSSSAQATSAPQHLSKKVFVENAASTEALRGNLIVPFPSPPPPSWQNRTSLDAIVQWNAGHVGATLSDRFNVTAQNTFAFPSNQTLRNDLREAFGNLSLGHVGYFEAGRVNVRNGVALGFNPTDFFKTRTLVDQASLDPTILRQDRLGTVMTRLEASGNHGSVDLAFAPYLAPPSAISYVPQSGLNPRFDQTNSSNHVEFAVNGKLADLDPQALVYADNTGLRFGLNVSHEASKEIVVYTEWAGGAQPDLIARALSYGKLTGTLPAAAPSVLPNNSSVHFRNDVSVGASWTGAQNITVDVEYEYHQGGLTRNDWANWTNIGNNARTNTAVTGQLWYIRSYANAQQEPLVQQQFFIRADKPDAFVKHLDLTGFAFVNLYDGSLLGQLSASYDLSDRWTVGLYLNAEIGGSFSEHGSFPQARGVTFLVKRYL